MELATNDGMRSVSARDGTEGFSKLLQPVVEGEDVVTTRRGKPVARLAAIGAAAAEALSGT